MRVKRGAPSAPEVTDDETRAAREWRRREAEVEPYGGQEERLAALLARTREEAIAKVAEWLRSADCGARFGSQSWSLRQGIAESIEDGWHKTWRSRVEDRY